MGMIVWELERNIENIICDELRDRVRWFYDDCLSDVDEDEYRDAARYVLRQMGEDVDFIHETADYVVPVYSYDVFALLADSYDVRACADYELGVGSYDNIEAVLRAAVYTYAYAYVVEHLKELLKQHSDE